jgi:hypothetical protein
VRDEENGATVTGRFSSSPPRLPIYRGVRALLKIDNLGPPGWRWRVFERFDGGRPDSVPIAYCRTATEAQEIAQAVRGAP